MSKARLEIELATKGVSAVQTSLNRVLGGVKSWATGIGAALGAALSFRELAAGLKSAVDALDKAGASAQRFGLATQTLSTFAYAATISKSNTEGLETALRFLNRSLGEASTGSAATVETFRRLGVEFLNTDGTLRRTDEVMLSLADRFSALPNGAEKVAVALQLLGRSGTEMIPFLNNGSQALRELMAEAREFGLEVTPEAAQAAGDFNDNLERLAFAGQGFYQTVAAQVLPALVEFTARMVDALKESHALGTAAGWLAGVIQELALLAVGAAEALKVLATAFDVATDYLSILFFAIGRFMGSLADLTETVGLSVTGMVLKFTALGEVFELILDRRFSAAAARAKTLMGEIAADAGRMTADVAKAVARVASVPEEVGLYALEVQERARAKLNAAVTGAQDSLLAYQLKSNQPVPVAKTLTDFDAGAVAETAEIARKQTKLDLEQQAQALADRRLALTTQIGRIENDRWFTDAARWRETLKLRTEELGLIDSYVLKLKERLALEKDEATRQLITQQLRQAQRDRATLGNQVFGQQSAGDPAALTDQMFLAADAIARRIGTLAQQVARSFTDVIGSAVDGIAGSLAGLIQGTMDWADALRNVARTMGTAVVNAISKMFAEWLVGRAMMAMKNILFSQQEGVADAAAKAPGALMSSISSFGIAALVGTAALLAALAAFGGGFAEGGAVRGPGGPKSDGILARLSNGEYVVNAQAVRDYGQPLLDALNRRSLRVSAGEDNAITSLPMPPAGTGRSASAAGALNLVLVDSRNQARQFLESADGEARIVDIVRRHRMKIGVPT